MQIYKELKKDSYIWELFTRQEEYIPSKLDKYGRFLSRFSRYQTILYPYVSDYLIKQGQFNFEYPENKKFAVVLTHDVDDISISNQHIIRSLLPFPINRDKLGFKRIFIEKLRGNKSSYNNFKQILGLEEKYDAKSSFYFLVKNNDIFGYKYKIDDIKEDICLILDNECEVGLHTSYYAFDKLDEIISEKEKLEKIIGKNVKGVRNHLLRFSIPKSWEILSKAGFAYDTTLGYHDSIGFRNGMCHPFQPFNLNTNKKIDIIEMPLCLSDMALFSFMKKSAIESWDIIKKVIDATEILGGVLTLLWHNWTFSYPVSYAGLFGKEWTILYEKILEYCYKRNAWLTNGKNVSKFISKYY
jgi:peptidoglycan/xylan/chitin deacetylase (PgdA/CDA1 family)